MSYDAMFLMHHTAELASILKGRKVEKISQHSDRAVSLSFSYIKDKRLYIDISSSAPRMLLSGERADSPFSAPMFCMLMRKQISGGIVLDVRQLADDRVVEILIEARDEMFEKSKKRLIVEIMGRHSNCILTAEDYTVIDCLKRVGRNISSRQMGPGIPYKPPFEPKKSFLGAADICQLLDGIRKAETSAKNTLVSEIALISPQIALSLLKNAGLEDKADLAFSNLTDAEILSLAAAFEKLKSGIDETKCRIYTLPQKREISSVDLSVFEGADIKLFEDFSSGIQEYFMNERKADVSGLRKEKISEFLKGAISKLEDKLPKLEEDLISSKNADIYRLKADIINSNPRLIRSGMERVRLPDYEGGEIEIDLNPRLSSSQNAENYYKLYNKCRRAENFASAQIEQTRGDLAYLESIKVSLDYAETEFELDEIERELQEAGYINKKKSGAGNKKKQTKLGPREFKTPGGFILKVGRNNRQNDELSLKIAKKEHIWFHTKDIPSSHAVVTASRNELTDEDIVFAASVVAHYSKARLSSNVPVDYTEIKNVKKPAGMPVGMVIYEKQKTVYVDPIDGNEINKLDG